MEVSTYREGEVPLMVSPDDKPKKKTKRSQLSVASSHDPSLRYNTISVAADDQERQAFASIVKMVVDEDVIAAPPSNTSYGFESFAGADLVFVGKHLWAVKTARDPTWNSEAVKKSVFDGLWTMLGFVKGKGPTACQISSTAIAPVFN